MRCRYCQKEFPVNDEQMAGGEIQCPQCGVSLGRGNQKVIFNCPQCSKPLEGELWMYGKQVECSCCGKEICFVPEYTPEEEKNDFYLPPGSTIGHYLIKRCIGKGGMGEVYLAHHTLLDRHCALKLIRPNHQGTVGDSSFESLIHEARLACRIHSPNIIDVMDVDIDRERNFGYIVMEYVEGKDVVSMLENGAMNEELVLNIAKGVCHALIAAAPFAIVHRDIKPANIMITNSGEVKLADLGIAQSKREQKNQRSKTIAGTLNYASPEQLTLDADVDCRSDVYSLGATMYHMLSGKMPFDNPSVTALLSQVQRGEFEPLEKVAPEVSPECCALVNLMMSTERAKRPANAEKLLKMLDELISDREKKIRNRALKWKIGIASGAAALLLLGGAAVAMSFSGGDKVEELPELLSDPAPKKEAPAAVQSAETVKSETPAAAPAGEEKTSENTTPPAEEKKEAAPPKAPVEEDYSVTGFRIGFINLLLLAAWILSGLKVLPFLAQRKMQNSPLVAPWFGYWNLAALFAGPLVYLIVVWNEKYAERFRALFEKKEECPVIVDSQSREITEESYQDKNSDAVYYLRRVLAAALKLRATDIFFDPAAGGSMMVRLRVDGSLRDVEELDCVFATCLIAMIRHISGMRSGVNCRTQAGRFSLAGAYSSISVCVSAVPAFGGEKTTLRILGGGIRPENLSSVGFSGRNLMVMEQAVRLPSGLVLIAGPAGSGRTTTVYAMLKSLDYSVKNAISIEDPIEYALPKVSQMEIDEQAGLGFPQLIHNALQQKPDVICVSEIRDEQTAQMAVYAAQTGHLVIAGIDSNDCVGALERLAGFNIPLDGIAGTLRSIVSQRLVRKLCSCRKSKSPSEEEKNQFRSFGMECAKLFIPKGCDKCAGTGYSGRAALFDILTVDDHLRSLLEDKQATLFNIQQELKLANSGNMMLRSGLELALREVTSIEEVMRVSCEFE